jgi:hypothetical protein
VSIFPLGIISSGLVLCGHFYLFETSDPLFAEWLAPGTVAVEGQAPKTFIQVEPEWGEKECFSAVINQLLVFKSSLRKWLNVFIAR